MSEVGVGAGARSRSSETALELAVLERDVLAVLTRKRSAPDALDFLARGLEELTGDGMLASILTLDDERSLRHGAAPSLPEGYTRQIDGVRIGEGVGSCGTACHRASTVIVSDIATDPLWKNFQHIALAFELRACWSVPIVAATGEVLGAFAFYYREPRLPDGDDVTRIEGAARLARIVLDHERAERDRARATRRERALFGAARVLAEAEEVTPALVAVVEAVATSLEWDAGAVWLRRAGETELSCAANWSRPDARIEQFVALSAARTFAAGEGLPGRVLARGEPEWLTIGEADAPSSSRRGADGALRAGFALPIVLGRETAGAVEFFTTRPERVDTDLVYALRTIGLQIGQFLRRAEAQAEQRRLVEHLRETVRFRELFSAVLAHDLRSPLSSISVGTELLLAIAPDPLARGTLTRMRATEQRMGRMIEQLLDLTRTRSPEALVLATAPMDLADVTRSVLSEICVAHPARPVAFEHLGDCRGLWDSDKLAQVVSNLAGNAVQHGDPGEEVAITLDGRDPSQVLLVTRNAGTIPEELVSMVFDPYRRAATGAQTHGGGLGLGLYITKLVVEAHAGTVTVASGPAGTTFRVALPRGECPGVC